jgi:hypothetical protein
MPNPTHGFSVMMLDAAAEPDARKYAREQLAAITH